MQRSSHGLVAFWLALGAWTGLAAAQGRTAESPPAAGPADRTRPVVLEGFVLSPEGPPAEGAVVVSSAGGRAVTDRSGRYRLALRIPEDAARIEITATGAAEGSSAASESVTVASSGGARVRPILLEQGPRPRWWTTFGTTSGIGGVGGGLPSTATVFDDGAGPALYVGGSFDNVGTVVAHSAARWDGSTWAAVDAGLRTISPVASDFEVYDDGTGPALHAAGRFEDSGGFLGYGVARWDGSRWASLGSDFSSGVNNLVVFDDGDGPALYASGSFTSADGHALNRIGKWDGATWVPLGSGVSSTPQFTLVFDDGTGAALYVGGPHSAGGVQIPGIARWDGTSWSSFGGTLSRFPSDLEVFDDRSGPSLYLVSDNFRTSNVERWNGSLWLPIGAADDLIHDLWAFDDGTGPALYAGGEFSSIDGVLAEGAAKWDGVRWTPLGAGVAGAEYSGVYDFTSFDRGSGAMLHALGSFVAAGETSAAGIAGWDGTSWYPVVTGGGGLDNTVRALAVAEEASQPVLVAAGDFTAAGRGSALRVARWNAAGWSPLGGGVDDTLHAVAVFDDGSGPAVYAGGDFSRAGGTFLPDVARWDGSEWSSLAGGIGGVDEPLVHALAVYDDGSGPALYVGGDFRSAGGQTLRYLARWDGSAWSAVGGVMNDVCRSLTVLDDGTGPALFAAGDFTTVGSLVVRGIAKWNGTRWSLFGSGFDGTVLAVAAFDHGSGPVLHAGGAFTASGTTPIQHLARWTGSAWEAVGGGANDVVEALAVFDDGTRRALYAGGGFTVVGGLAASHVARWDGASWSALGSGVPEDVTSLAVFEERGEGGAPGRSLLVVGGAFPLVPDSGDSFIGAWGPATAGADPRAR